MKRVVNRTLFISTITMRYLHSTEALSLLCYSLVQKMKINDKAFNGSTSYLATANISKWSLAKISLGFRNLHQDVSLLEKTYTFLCQRSSGVVMVSSFRAPSSPMWHDYWMLNRSMCLYITLTDTYLVRLLFQRVDYPRSVILVSCFNYYIQY